MAFVGVVPRAHPERLEYLVKSKAEVIAVEDDRLGGELFSSIQIGNFLHKTAVLSGLAFTVSSFTRSALFVRLTLPLGTISVVCAGFYDFIWQRDALCQYQVDQSGDELTAIPTSELVPNASYTVLVHRDNTARKIVHNTFALITLGIIGLRFWRR